MASLENIEGIGPKKAAKLRKAGVKGTGTLLSMGATRKGRKEMAKASGMTDKAILECVNRCDLMRVKGVGSEYSDLLECAGVDTVKELAQRNAKNLFEAMGTLNDKKKLVRRPPSQPEVTSWVAQAKKMKAVVTY